MRTQNKKGAPRLGMPPIVSAPDDSRLAVTMREAADLLAVSERTIWTMCNSGELPSVLIGRCRRIPMDALRRLIGGDA